MQKKSDTCGEGEQNICSPSRKKSLYDDNTFSFFMSNKQKSGTLVKLKQYNDTVHKKAERKSGYVKGPPQKRHILLQIFSGLLSITSFLCFIAGFCFPAYLHGNYKKVLICAAVCFVCRCSIEAFVTARKRKTK